MKPIICTTMEQVPIHKAVLHVTTIIPGGLKEKEIRGHIIMAALNYATNYWKTSWIRLPIPIVKRMENQIIGQGYFLRAYYYHMLYSVYGRIPLIDHTYDLDSEFKEERADMDDVADFIVADCDKAAELLPTVYKDASDFGRATKGAALALKGRVLLYKASPLFGTPSRENGRRQQMQTKQSSI